MTLKISRLDAIHALWRKGELSFKLNSAQKKLYKTFYGSSYRIPVFNCSRRLGKSRTLLCIALEHAIRMKNAIIHYACPTAKMATQLVLPEINKLLNDCPEDLKPVFIKNESEFKFKNGSCIRIAGVDDGNAERLRGQATNLGIVDEAGFVSDLDNLIQDIMGPQLLTTNGKLLLASTPPKIPGHPFAQVFIERAKKNNAYIKISILEAMELIKNDPPHLRHINPEMVNEMMDLAGGPEHPTWRREYLAEIITSLDSVVVPEFNDKAESEIVKEFPRPRHFDAYISMDPGLVDHTGILFAHYNFDQAKLVIDDELFFNGSEVNTESISAYIKEKEKQLYWNELEKKSRVFIRVSDHEHILLNDLARQHQLFFVPAKKDDKEAALNDVRRRVQKREIIINPRCKNLVYQLRNTTWNKARTSFLRTKQGSHGDLVDALIYLVRTIHWHKNPYPIDISKDNDTHYGSQEKQLTQTEKTFKSIFSRK